MPIVVEATPKDAPTGDNRGFEVDEPAAGVDLGRLGKRERQSSRESDESVATPRSADHSRPLQPEASPGEPELVDSPYRTWCADEKLPDPTSVRPSHLIKDIIDIVSTEGPMSARLVYRTFVKAAGRKRVGKNLGSTLVEAVSKAIGKGFLEASYEASPLGPEELIVRKADSPVVVVRRRGNREFVEIPMSEVATVMLRLMHRDPGLRGRALYRAVLDFYETQRMTPGIKQRLHWIDKRQRQLTESDERGQNWKSREPHEPTQSIPAIDGPVAAPGSIDHSRPLQPEASPGEPEFGSPIKLDTMTKEQKFRLLRHRRNHGLLQTVAKTLWLPEKNVSQVYWGSLTSSWTTEEIEKELERRMGAGAGDDAS